LSAIWGGGLVLKLQLSIIPKISINLRATTNNYRGRVIAHSRTDKKIE